MKHSPIRHTFSSMSILVRILIIMLFLVLLVSIVYFVRGIWDVRYNGLNRPNNPLGIVLSGSRPAKINMPNRDIDSIEVWMTFSYINVAFQLPWDLLSTKLKIKDFRYPNLSLRNYIKDNKLDKELLLQQIKEIIRASTSKDQEKQ